VSAEEEEEHYKYGDCTVTDEVVNLLPKSGQPGMPVKETESRSLEVFLQSAEQPGCVCNSSASALVPVTITFVRSLCPRWTF